MKVVAGGGLVVAESTLEWREVTMARSVQQVQCSVHETDATVTRTHAATTTQLRPQSIC